MSEITRVYQVRIWNDDASGVEYTFDGTDIVGIPEFGWTTPRPLEGRVENIPSVVRILDTGEQVTAALADADGRAVLMGRIADIRINESGGGLEMRLSGRISAIQMADTIGAYDFFISDERWAENKDVFTTSAGTTSLIPSGVLSAFLQAPIAAKMRLKVVEVVSANLVRFTPQRTAQARGTDSLEGGMPILSQEVVDYLDEDTAIFNSNEPEAGAFRFTRCFAGGADREIYTFGEGGYPVTPIWTFREMAENGQPLELQSLTLAWTGHSKNVGDTVSDAYVYAPNAPASPGNPHHVGGEEGVDFFTWLKARYDDIGIRYDTNAFTAWDASTNPLGLVANPVVPLVAFRAVKPESLRKLVERTCAAMGIVPFTSLAGEVAPRHVFLPQAVDPSGLPIVTSAKATRPHPTWVQKTDNLITVVTGDYTYYRYVYPEEVLAGKEAPTDRIVPAVKPLIPQEHDRVSELGSHVHNIDMTMIQGVASNYLYFQRQTKEIFDRYGDGPIQGSLRSLSALKAVDAGDYVVISLATFPNPATQARGGTRVVQIMGRRTETGHVFDWLDAGPNEQPLQAPGVAIVKGASDPLNEVDVTISSLTAGASYQLQLRNGGGGTWYDAGQGSANETITIRGIPSGTQIFAQARETAPGRIRSAWSAAVNDTTDTLGAVTGLAVDNEAGDRAEFDWTVAEADFPLEILLDGTRITTLQPGTSFYVLRGLATSTTYNGPGFTVRHYDLFGGVGTAADQAFTTTGTPTQLTEPFALAILVGGPPV